MKAHNDRSIRPRPMAVSAQRGTGRTVPTAAQGDRRSKAQQEARTWVAGPTRQQDTDIEGYRSFTVNYDVSHHKMAWYGQVQTCGENRATHIQ
jgi:hypothetical protein